MESIYIFTFEYKLSIVNDKEPGGPRSILIVEGIPNVINEHLPPNFHFFHESPSCISPLLERSVILQSHQFPLWMISAAWHGPPVPSMGLQDINYLEFKTFQGEVRHQLVPLLHKGSKRRSGIRPCQNNCQSFGAVQTLLVPF